MPTVFTVAEAIELSKLGKFDILSIDLNLALATAVVLPAVVPIPASSPPAVNALVGFVSGYRVLTERFNFGGTDAPNSVYYELHDEKGYYCGNEIKQSNQENHCTHICTGNYVNLRLWNITLPPAAVYIDFTCWYYIWPTINDEKVMAILKAQPNLLREIVDQLSSIRQAVGGPPPLPQPGA
jgi:hypothetical protein